MDDERHLPYGNYKSDSSKKRANSELDNGRHKRRNTDDGVSAKTIDTLYRILCPVKKIGSVLGRGGDIVNALRDETHAKIRVVDAIAGADERVIIIFSYPHQEEERYNKIQNTINDNLSGGDNQDMKPHCPAQEALLKIHERIAADEYMRGGVLHENTEPQGDVSACILVPSNQVGCLLGKGGIIVQKLRQDTRANIRILRSDLPPCAMRSDELIEISGKPVIVKKALYEISTLLHHHPRKENPPLEDILSASTQSLYRPGPEIPSPLPHGNPMLSRYTPPPSWFDGYRTKSYNHGLGSFDSGAVRNGELEDFYIKILCPTEKIGGIIGKSGANVRHLERQTGASIHVKDTDPDDRERVIVVSSKEALSNPVSPTIEAILQLQSRASNVSVKGEITTRLLISSSKIGCLLGKGGEVIKDMRHRTRADIRVYSKSEILPKYASNDEELVQISGSEIVAETALSEIASRLRARFFQKEGTSVDSLITERGDGFAHSENFSRRARQPSSAIGPGNPALNDYPLSYEYPEDSHYSKGYAHPRIYDYPKSYDYPKDFGYPKDYDYTKMYDYPKEYDYPRGSDFTKSYEYSKDASQHFNPRGYPGLLHPTVYSDRRSSVEIKTPRSSVLGIMSGRNVSDAHQVLPPGTSWRYKDNPSR